jgi:hypothetical protein
VTEVRAVCRTKGANRSANHSALLSACEEYVRLHGGWTLRIIGGVGQRAGSPDCVGVLAGRALCIEAKTGRARLSVAQEREQVRWIEAGAVYCVVRALDDLEAALYGAGVITARSLWPRREEGGNEQD